MVKAEDPADSLVAAYQEVFATGRAWCDSYSTWWASSLSKICQLKKKLFWNLYNKLLADKKGSKSDPNYFGDVQMFTMTLWTSTVDGIGLDFVEGGNTWIAKGGFQLIKTFTE